MRHTCDRARRAHSTGVIPVALDVVSFLNQLLDHQPATIRVLTHLPVSTGGGPPPAGLDADNAPEPAPNGQGDGVSTWTPSPGVEVARSSSPMQDWMRQWRASPELILPPKPCECCKSSVFWQSVFGAFRCYRCHPPPFADCVMRWVQVVETTASTRTDKIDAPNEVPL